MYFTGKIISFFFIGGLILIFLFTTIHYFLGKSLKDSKEGDTPKYPEQLKCLDGHIVKSRGELIIDNYLYRLKIKHIYEGEVIVNDHVMKYDWYLPDFDVYIEYWGYYGKEYLDRKEEKIRLYKEGNLQLISIEDEMFRDIYTHLRQHLEKYGEIGTLKKRKKFCPNCGALLDDRFT